MYRGSKSGGGRSLERGAGEGGDGDDALMLDMFLLLKSSGCLHGWLGHQVYTSNKQDVSYTTGIAAELNRGSLNSVISNPTDGGEADPTHPRLNLPHPPLTTVGALGLAVVLIWMLKFDSCSSKDYTRVDLLECGRSVKPRLTITLVTSKCTLQSFHSKTIS